MFTLVVPCRFSLDSWSETAPRLVTFVGEGGPHDSDSLAFALPKVPSSSLDTPRDMTTTLVESVPGLLTIVSSVQTLNAVAHHADPGMVGRAEALLVRSIAHDAQTRGRRSSLLIGQTVFVGSVHRRSGSLVLQTEVKVVPMVDGVEGERWQVDWTWNVVQASDDLQRLTGDGGFRAVVPLPRSSAALKLDSDADRLNEVIQALGPVDVAFEFRFP